MDDTSRFENADRAVKAIGELRERIQAAMLPVNTNNCIRDIILSSFTGGQAYVNNHIPAVAQSAAARPEEPTSLFVQDNEGSEYEEPDGDYDDDGGEEVDIDCDVDTLVTWLNSLAPQIVSIVPLLTLLFVFTNILQKALHAPPEPGFPTPCPKLAIEPQSHQYRALGLIERSRDIPPKAMFIADPPGLGKTLPAMMAIVKSIPTAHRRSPSELRHAVVHRVSEVFPTGWLSLWLIRISVLEAEYLQEAIRVLVLRDPTITAVSMMNYDGIIVSYNLVMSRYRKTIKFLEQVVQANEHGAMPIRPNTSLFSEIFHNFSDEKSQYLVLDEANAVKNESSLTFEAVAELCQQCEVCVMLSGSPIDNAWPDVYAALQMVENHDIRSKQALMRLIGTKDDKLPGAWKPPTGRRCLRLIQLLNSYMMRRPETVVNLPPLIQKAVYFKLTWEEEGLPNEKFATYQTAMRIAASERKKDPPYKSLIHALQYACHPKLVELMEFISIQNGDKVIPTEDEEEVFHNADDIIKWNNWRQDLRETGQ